MYVIVKQRPPWKSALAEGVSLVKFLPYLWFIRYPLVQVEACHGSISVSWCCNCCVLWTVSLESNKSSTYIESFADSAASGNSVL